MVSIHFVKPIIFVFYFHITKIRHLFIKFPLQI
nr:MAG TPA: hypothetical protein [Caudoviricetes sp.]